MRKTLIALAAIGGLTGGASAMPVPTTPQISAIQSVDWYCGPHCQQRRYWRDYNPYWHQPYGYHHGYGYQYRGYPYYGYNRGW